MLYIKIKPEIFLGSGESLMLYIKIQPEIFLGSGEDFQIFVSYGYDSHLVQWHGTI